MASQVSYLELPQLTNGAAGLDGVASGASKEGQEVIKALKASHWLDITPATEGKTVGSNTYSSRGFATE